MGDIFRASGLAAGAEGDGDDDHNGEGGSKKENSHGESIQVVLEGVCCLYTCDDCIRPANKVMITVNPLETKSFRLHGNIRALSRPCLPPNNQKTLD